MAGIASIDSTLIDSSNVEQRLPTNETIQDYKKDSDLNYEETKIKDTSWWDGFWRWLKSKLKIKEPKGETYDLSVVGWILLIIIVLALLYFIFRNQLTSIWGRSGYRTSKALKTEFLDLSAKTEDIEKQLEQAITYKNYKEAIRLYYTLALKYLNQGGHINFRIDKTNNEYLYELPDGQLRQPFKALTFYFDYIFYGKFEATESIYLRMKENFQQLNQNAKKSPQS